MTISNLDLPVQTLGFSLGNADQLAGELALTPDVSVARVSVYPRTVRPSTSCMHASARGPPTIFAHSRRRAG